MNILFIGDIVGKSGRKAVKYLLPEIKDNYHINLIIANGENAAGGFGLTRKVAEELYSYDIDCLTMGNHTWDNKDIFRFIDDDLRLVRPLNFNPGVPGHGWRIIKRNDFRVAVVNLIGQVFMGNYNSPFIEFNRYLPHIKKQSDLIVIDFHAEATSEKMAFANYVDGQVACVIGTHTHVQTADERILPGGTGYITDLGLTGAVDSILGMDKNAVIERFLKQIPVRFSVGKGQIQLAGLIIKTNDNTGLTENIFRLKKSL